MGSHQQEPGEPPETSALPLALSTSPLTVPTAEINESDDYAKEDEVLAIADAAERVDADDSKSSNTVNTVNTGEDQSVNSASGQMVPLSIFEAVRQGDLTTVERMVEAKPDRVHELDWAQTPLIFIACMLQQYDICRLLVDRGANIDTRDALGKKPLQYVRDVKVAQQILDIRYNPVVPDIDAEYVKCFQEAAFDGDTNYIYHVLSTDYYVAKGEDGSVEFHENMPLAYDPMVLMDKKDERGNTALMFACMGGRVETATYLLECGANSKHTNNEGRNAIWFMTNAQKNKIVADLAFNLSPEGILYNAEQAILQEEEWRAYENALMGVEDFDSTAIEMHIRHELYLQRHAASTEFVTETIESTVYKLVEEARDRKMRELIEADRQMKLERARYIERSRLAYEKMVEERNREKDRFSMRKEDLRSKMLNELTVKKIKREKKKKAAEEAQKQAEEDAAVRLVAFNKAKREAERMARLEWIEIQADMRNAAWEWFDKHKGERIIKYKRLHKGLSKM